MLILQKKKKKKRSRGKNENFGLSMTMSMPVPMLMPRCQWWDFKMVGVIISNTCSCIYFKYKTFLKERLIHAN